MAKGIRVGQRVRINERYAEVGGPEHVGKEFDVVDVFPSAWRDSDGEVFEEVVIGDPMCRGVWGNYLDIISVKAHSPTIISTTLGEPNLERIVRISNGPSGLSLSVTPNPAKPGIIDGTTAITPEQAEEIANDLLARVAEIRGGK